MSEQAPAPQLRLGTFIGVFTPTILTILGVIMYLRLGWVVGNAGWLGALVIVVFANGITLVTALSLSALATNMRVGVGGAYYLISRSLGLEVGGAIGIPLYLSQTLSVTLYCYGLGESIRIVWPGAPVGLLAALFVVAVTAVAARSTELALRMQVPIMVLIAASLVSLFLGVEWRAPQVDALGPWEDAGFWQVFAVFFPAVTGILAGVSLSGDLADPGKAIPRGVLGAVAVGFVVYATIPLVLAYGASAPVLREDTLVWTSIAAVPLLVMPGLWGAVLSSAFGSILSAPRTLQALASDRLLPARLAELDPKTGEPLVALRISGGLALLAVLLGDLDAVATVLTMFFLTTYGTLNFVAGLERLVGDPSYRPRIKIPAWVSFAGAGGCFVGMTAISPLGAAVALTIEALIFWTLSRRSMQAAWGDVRSGAWQAAARWSLLRLREARHDPRNWRPNILVFVDDVAQDVPIVRMASRFSQHRGIVTVHKLLLGDVEEHPEAEELVRRSDQILASKGILAFSEAATVTDLDAGVITVAQANGFAGLSSNTVMFPWPGDDVDQVARLLTLSRKLAGLHKCTLIGRPIRRDRRPKPHLDVWWKGRESNGDLMLLLAHLLTLSDDWRDVRIVLKSVAETAEEAAERRREFGSLLPEIRIEADVDVIVRDGEPVVDLIHRSSADAELVFLGMSVPAAGEERAYAESLAELVRGLPGLILVRNAGPFRGRLV